MELPINRHEKILLKEINPYLTCYLCRGYLIDATAISECLHTFCRTCIIEYLQDHSYCPICEVIINKAKPNLKLDKTLQDIVYKLVPELFLREMTRRKQFYQHHPQVAVRVTPEERGEDTERTIFNPQDCISLSLEYVSDDSAPNAIRLPCPKNGSDPNKQLTAEESQALMKRYLQCPGMCRIEVLKKFVRNKYNVDTSSFYIDILYKKVPLPDHYTLIDIAYIYSWKRNEPMKFFFRITDHNNANEQFDLFNTTNPMEFFAKRRTKVHRTSKRRERRRSAKQPSQETLTISDAKGKNECDNVADNKADDAKEIEKCEDGAEKNDKLNEVSDEKTEDAAVEAEPVVEAPKEDNNSTSAQIELSTKTEPPDVAPKPKPAETTAPNTKDPVTVTEPTTPTNVIPNRTDNVEMTNKLEETVRQTPKTDPVTVQKNYTDSLNVVVRSVTPPPDTEDEQMKRKFLHSMQLIPKSPPPKPSGKSPGSKRKTASPVKSDKAKKIKTDKKPNAAVQNLHNNGLKSIIENCKIPSSLSITIKESDDGTKSLSLPPVKNFIEILKLPSEIKKGAVAAALPTPSKLDFKFCDNDSEQKVDQDLAEIARSLTEKIPMSTTISQIVGPKSQFAIPMKPSSKSLKESKRISQSFQKIFEESIKKPEGSAKASETGQKVALNLSNEATSNNNNNNKRKILEIASQLYKKTKQKHEKPPESKKDIKIPPPRPSTPKVPIPRLNSHRPNSTSPNPLNFGQTLANMHSNALGLNYTISVGQNPPNGTKPPERPPPTEPGNSPKPALGVNSPKHSPKSSPLVKHMYAPVMDPLKVNTVSPKLSPKPSSSKTTPKASPTQPLSPNQILEKYNIQNLAQLTASLNFGLNQNAQLAALQQAMMYKHLDMQSRQGWLNQGPMLQYEKYLQSLKTNQNHLLGNIKEN